MMNFFSACSGIVLTSYNKYDPNRHFERKMTQTILKYLKFKKITRFNDKYKGMKYVKPTLFGKRKILFLQSIMWRPT